MSQWFRMYESVLDDPKVQRLPAETFRAQFIAAARGEQNDLSKFVRPDRGRPGNAEWAAIRAEIFERDDYTCTYCSERGGRLECDHILPVARGGTDDQSNLTTACFTCNRSKRDKTPEEWRR